MYVYVMLSWSTCIETLFRTLYAMLAIVIQLWAVVAHITSRVDTPRQEALWQKSVSTSDAETYTSP
jgi:hypothetical protein